ncbi:MAG: PH domain-containing protein [Mycobacteriaceae bacterium]
MTAKASRTQAYRSAFGAWITGVAVVLSAGIAATITLSDHGVQPLEYSWTILFITITWAAYWRPSIVVNDSNIIVHNVFHTVTLPWEKIVRVDTKFALTFFTNNKKFTAWAAPSTGRHTMSTLGQKDYRGLPESTFIGRLGIRPGDTLASDSGRAAYLIRLRWEQRQDTNSFVDHQIQPENVTVRWHRKTIMTIALLAIACVITLFS